MARQALFGGSDQAFSRPRVSEGADLDITPMIDVTFLLLIFFMVASTMQAQTDLNVPAAKHGEGVPADTSTEIIVLAPQSATETPRILLGDLKGPEGTVDDVRRFVEEGLRQGKTEVVVKADRDVPSGFVQRVLKAISEVEGVQFSIGVQDEQSKR